MAFIGSVVLDGWPVGLCQAGVPEAEEIHIMTFVYTMDEASITRDPT